MLQGLTHLLRLYGKGLYFGSDASVGRTQSNPTSPVGDSEFAQGFFGGGHGGGGERRGVLQPVEHVVAGRVPHTGLQQPHHLCGGAGGGQLPAVFVALAHTVAVEHGTHTPRQQAVGGHQRHGGVALGDVLQHTGGGTLGFVFCTLRGVQSDCAQRGVLRQHDVHQLLVPQLAQRTGRGQQRVGLETFKHHHTAHTRQRLLQHVGGVTRGQRPLQSNPCHRAFERQHGGVHAQGDSCTCGSRPRCARVQRHGGHLPSEGLGGLDQALGQHIPVRPQPGALQQIMGCEQVVGRIKTEVVRRGQHPTQAARPVHGGFKPRRKPGRVGCHPEITAHLHELGVGHKHHRVGRMGSTFGQCAVDLGNGAVHRVKPALGDGRKLGCSQGRRASHHGFWL